MGRKLKVKILRTQKKTAIVVPVVGLSDVEFNLLTDVLMDEGFKFSSEGLSIILPNEEAERELRFLNSILKPYFQISIQSEEV